MQHVEQHVMQCMAGFRPTNNACDACSTITQHFVIIVCLLEFILASVAGDTIKHNVESILGQRCKQ